MKKNIVIIGGGISGLSFLHFLRSRDPQADVCLLEREDICGGTVRSFPQQGFIFEHGPNGVLANQPLTLQLFCDLELDQRLIEASQSSKKRYILKNGQLNFVPSNPLGLLRSGYLTFPEMLRAAGDLWKSKGNSSQETIFAFASRRFGTAVAEKLFDPLIKGIYGGNVRRLHMSSAFPKIARLEEECGSVIRGMMGRKRNPASKRLLSFQDGMQTVTDALSRKYAGDIRSGVDVQSVECRNGNYVIQTSRDSWEADHVVLSVPAYAAAGFFKQSDSILSDFLSRVEYAPMAVVGMIFSRKDWKDPVEGYGYLVSSSEQTPVLGVLFEDQVFQRRLQPDQMFVRVMIGGSDYPDIIKKIPEDIQKLAREHLQKVLNLTSAPQQTMMKIWPKAIPQYTVEYSQIKKELSLQLASRPRLHLLANYWNGVSFNDCVENAHRLALNLH